MKKRALFITSFVFLIIGFLFFSNISPAQAATSYFCTGNGDWSTASNWKADAGCVSAGSIPGVGDDAVILADVNLNGGPAASVNTMTVNGTVNINIPVTVANGATFNDTSYNNTSGTILGDATFNNLSFNAGGGGTITGNATFNNSGNNNGLVSGNATFNNSSFNTGTISGNATFYDSSYNKSVPFPGTVSGNATFNGLSYNDGTISGNATFNDTSYNFITGTVSVNASTIATFNNATYNNGTVSGNAFFNNSSYNNAGTVFGNATFNDLSQNNAGVASDASFYDSTVNNNSVSGNACFATTATNNGSVGGTITLYCPTSIPTVTTNSATTPTTSSADLFGAITNTGGESANTVGFQYYAQNSSNTTYSDTISTAGTFVRQAFDKVATSLTFCGLYHYRAFATNSAGTGYGGDLTFTANACLTGGGGGPITPPTPTCASPKVLVNNACVTPTPIVPTCTSAQILINNVCVAKAPTLPPPPVTPPPPVVSKTTPPAPTPPATPSTTQSTPSSSSGRTITPPVTSLPTNSGSNILGSVLGAARVITNSPPVKLVANVAVLVPVAASLIVLAAALLAGMPLANYLFYLFVVFSQILGFAKKPKPWGTVYDSYTKKPLPFARVEILNEQSRKLQSTVTDANGRYGFLISDQTQKIQFQAHLTKYDFPSQEQPSVVEQKLYPNIYKGGLVDVRGGQANYDLPMHPREKALMPNFYFGITSVKLNNLLTSAANVLFVVGAAFGLSNAIVNPSAVSYSILALIFLTFLVRISGFKLKPFGLTKDTQTNKTLPFGLITLNNQGGERLNFTVSDDQGRYFMLTPKGNYILKAYTPSHISPTRTKELSISTRKGWISQEVLL